MKDFFMKVTYVFQNISLQFKHIDVLPKLLLTIGLFIFIHWGNKVIFGYIDKADLTSKRTIKLKKITSFVENIFFIIIIIPIWIYESKDILTFLGLFSAGMAFAFKDLVSNFLGWIIINSHKPFEVGDRIKIGDNIGDVLEIEWFYTTIIEVTEANKTYGQSTGRLTHIPNIKLLTTEAVNETNTFPYTWNEIDIPVTTKSNWQRAKKIILDSAFKELGNIEDKAKEALGIASKTHPIYYENLSHTVYTSLKDGKIVLTLRFICGSRNFRNLEHNIIEDILKEFGKYDDIEIL
ncbi:mechanosensitive ion channel family protein [Clostridium rectalis]|uniref:mechanosensitive ion channel family protein n=1 Tax=Clostridium rectalis TaxID=2040295 RepID=UPI001FAA90F7|nr:mechanosensitive ion channel domain-containing protein [Clostridium rectalis]